MGKKYFPFSKPEGVVLEKENKFFLETRRNMVTFRCWKKEKNKFFFCGNIFWWRKNEGWRFELENDGKFFLGNQYVMACAPVFDPSQRSNQIWDAVLLLNQIPFSFICKTHFQCSFCKGYISL